MPELQKYSKDQWEKTFKTFIEQGFHSSNFMRIIGRRPELLRRSADKLVQSIECLRETQFGDESVIQLIEQHPEMLGKINSYFSTTGILSERLSVNLRVICSLVW